MGLPLIQQPNIILPKGSEAPDANDHENMHLKRGSAEENEFHISVRVCGVEGPGKKLSGQFFFVCEKEDREESSTKSIGGMTRPKDEWDLKLCLPSPTYLIRYLFILVGTTTPKLKLDAFRP